MKHIYTSFPTSKALSHIVVRLKIPSLVPICGLNALCRMLFSWTILVIAILTCIIFSNNLVTWLMRLIVQYSAHFCAFDFLGMLHIRWYIAGVLYIIIHRTVMVFMFCKSNLLLFHSSLGVITLSTSRVRMFCQVDA